MREIKFRGYNKELGRWFYGYLFIVTDGRNFIRCVAKREEKVGESFFDMLVEKDSVGQFTGLKDKNGKEIYVGDIIKWITIGEEGGNFEDIGVETDMGNHEVIFENGKFTTTKPNIPIGHINKRCEVIGNKFENPELLK